MATETNPNNPRKEVNGWTIVFMNRNWTIRAEKNGVIVFAGAVYGGVDIGTWKYRVTSPSVNFDKWQTADDLTLEIALMEEGKVVVAAEAALIDLSE